MKLSTAVGLHDVRFVSSMATACSLAIFFGGFVHRSRASEDEPKLSVSLLPERRNVRQGDALLLKIVCENVGTKDATIPQPSRLFHSLGIFVEVKPFTEVFLPVAEAGDPIVCGEFPSITLKPSQRYATYERVFQFTDGDFVFRKPGAYQIYASLDLTEAPNKRRIIKSDTVQITVENRSEEAQKAINNEAELIGQATDPRKVFLSEPGAGRKRDARTAAQKIEALDALRRQLLADDAKSDYPYATPANDDLGWRIDLLHIHYGSEDERAAARKCLQALRGDDDRLKAPTQEVLALLLAQLALERGDWAEAKKELRGVRDASREKEEASRKIEEQRSAAESSAPRL